MKFNLKKEVLIFFIIFFSISFFVYLFLNRGAYVRILRYNLSLLQVTLAESDIINKPYYLHIPKIEVSAPIMLPENDSSESILSSLGKGVALYPGLKLPGQTGQSVILGHSSKPKLHSGEYDYVFSLLNKLKIEDEFHITIGNNKLVYKVFADDILTPEQTNDLIFKTPKNESIVILVTCWPIGFSSKRAVIQAKLDRIEKI